MVKKRMLILGNAYMELTLTMDQMPKAGESTVSDGKYGFNGGGLAIVTAIAASALGIDAIPCATVGNDVYGNKLKALLDKNEISLRGMITHKTSPTALKVNLMSGASSPRSILYPAPPLRSGDIEEAFVSYPDGLMLCADADPLTMEKASAFAKSDGVDVFLQVPKADPESALHTLGRLKAAILGEEEIYSHISCRPDSLKDYVQCSIKLSSRINSDYFVFNLGTRGVYVTDGKYSELVAPFPAQPVDTRASGECFFAALCASYSQTKDMKQAAVRACAAQALCASKPGGITSIPDLYSLEEYLERNQR